MMSREKAKGRRSRASLSQKLNGSTYTPVRHDLLNSSEFNGLSPSAKIVFFCLLGKYRGSNNGDLELPQTAEQAKQIGISDPTLKKGLRELLETEFIELTRQGGKNHCSLYALTCYPIDEISRQGLTLKYKSASDKWKRPKPPD